MPIPCVDVVLVSGEKFLLCKRKNKPGIGKWCIPGGRVLRGETLRRAVIRKVEEETGLKKFKISKFITTREFFSSSSSFGVPTHSINSVFLVLVPPGQTIQPDLQSSKLQWFSRIDKKWLKYAQDMLKLAGFE